MTAADGNSKTRVFFEEGVSFRVPSMARPNEIFVIDGRLPKKSLPSGVRPVMTIEFYGREDVSNALFKNKKGIGKLTIEVGHYAGEEHYQLYIYDDALNPLATYPQATKPQPNDGRFHPDFDGYLVFEPEDFPDPIMGVGP